MDRALRALGLVLLPLLGLCLPLLLAEGVLRAVPALLPTVIRVQQASRDTVAPLFQEEPTLGWRGQPNGHGRVPTDAGEIPASQNALGYRGEMYPEDKPAGVWRVVFLGDSNTWGWGVADGEEFPLLTEQRLRASSPNVQVLNFALPSFGTDQEYLTYVNVARRYHPDLVVLVFFAGNDFADNISEYNPDGTRGKPHFVLDNGELRLIPTPTAAGSGPRGGKRSPSSGLSSLVNELKESSLTLAVARVELAYLKGQSSAGGADANRSRTLDYQQDGPAVTEALLKRLDADVRADGAQLVVALLPPPRDIQLQVGPRQPGGQPQSVLTWACGLGLSVVDLSPAVAAADQEAGTAWRGTVAGPHLNPVANRKVADLLAGLVSPAATTRSSGCP